MASFYDGTGQRGLQDALFARQQQAQGLAGMLGGGLTGALGQQVGFGQSYGQPPTGLRVKSYPPKPKTIREELQLETDEWLKDTI